jgi:hypothetical protein
VAIGFIPRCLPAPSELGLDDLGAGKVPGLPSHGRCSAIRAPRTERSVWRIEWNALRGARVTPPPARGQVCLLDQRGTGSSTRVTTETLVSAFGDDAAAMAGPATGLGLYPIVILPGTAQPLYARLPIIFSRCFSKVTIGCVALRGPSSHLDAA